MHSITANQIRIHGVSAMAEALVDAPEAMVSVRGRDRFVVMEIERCRYLRECELAAALAKSQADIAAGRSRKEPVAAHIKRLGRLA